MATKKKQQISLRRVMTGVSWVFRGGAYTSRPKFEDEVRRKNPSWDPGEVVFPTGQLRVQYQAWRAGNDLTGVVELASDNGEPFTAGEVLHKLHNAVVGPLREAENPAFEGLLQNEADHPRPSVTCVLCLAREGAGPGEKC